MVGVRQRESGTDNTISAAMRKVSTTGCGNTRYGNFNRLHLATVAVHAPEKDTATSCLYTNTLTPLASEVQGAKGHCYCSPDIILVISPS